MTFEIDENTLNSLIKESIKKTLIKESKKDKKEKNSALTSKTRSVLKWLKTDQENNAAIVRELWPEKDEDSARSLFSKKLRGEDSTGKKYSFTEDEITHMYNMKDSFISKNKS